MISDDEISIPGTPPELVEAVNTASLELLPKKSREKYENAYRRFMDYRMSKNTSSFSENVVMAYFLDLCLKMKSSTLWANYSMLKSTLALKHNVDISTYSKLRSLLKRQAQGYRTKKSKILTKEEIEKFIQEAPDKENLMIKEKLLNKLEESEPELAGCQEEECVICINAKATMETVPCGHKVVCRKCFVKTIQIAVSQRLLPLRCVICRAKVLRLRTGPALPSSVSGYSVNSRASSVPQSDSLYSVSSGGSSISSNSSASECGPGNHIARGGAAGGCCGGRCLGAYPRQPAAGAMRRGQQHSLKMRKQDYCRPDNRLPPIRELPGHSPSHNTPPASTRLRCAQKIVTQLESVSLLAKKKYQKLPLDEEEEEEEGEKSLLLDRDKRWWKDSKWSIGEDKSEERSDNKKNEIVEKRMEMKGKGKSILKGGKGKGKLKLAVGEEEEQF